MKRVLKSIKSSLDKVIIKLCDKALSNKDGALNQGEVDFIINAKNGCLKSLGK